MVPRATANATVGSAGRTAGSKRDQAAHKTHTAAYEQRTAVHAADAAAGTAVAYAPPSCRKGQARNLARPAGQSRRLRCHRGPSRSGEMGGGRPPAKNENAGRRTPKLRARSDSARLGSTLFYSTVVTNFVRFYTY